MHYCGIKAIILQYCEIMAILLQLNSKPVFRSDFLGLRDLCLYFFDAPLHSVGVCVGNSEGDQLRILEKVIEAQEYVWPDQKWR